MKNEEITRLIEQLPDLPEKAGLWSGRILTVMGYLEMTQRGVFKSTVGDKSNHQVVDKQDINGTLRAELRGIKVLTKIRDGLLMDLRDIYDDDSFRTKEKSLDDRMKKQLSFVKTCRKSEYLCGNCAVCVSLGSLNPGRFARRSRWFLPDMFSVEPVDDCVAGHLDFDEAGVLNTVESPSRTGMSSRSSSSFATYEYVKPGTRFPFKWMVRDPSKYDLFAFIKALNEVGQVDGIGAYSSRNGRFKVQFVAIADEAPLNLATNVDLAEDFSLLDSPDRLFPSNAHVIRIDRKENPDLVAYVYEKYDELLTTADWIDFLDKKLPEGEENE
ncbi:MAG: hypothetical protein D6732_06700 [Methanobacteriota archaeon]|nr:MAG: hypothetical protein D6732_06700 [Euryarchaeota archaeon]